MMCTFHSNKHLWYGLNKSYRPNDERHKQILNNRTKEPELHSQLLLIHGDFAGTWLCVQRDLIDNLRRHNSRAIPNTQPNKLSKPKANKSQSYQGKWIYRYRLLLLK